MDIIKRLCSLLKKQEPVQQLPRVTAQKLVRNEFGEKFHVMFNNNSNKFSRDPCCVIDFIRMLFYRYIGVPPMIYFDKYTKSLCFEYRFKDLLTSDTLSVCILFPMLYVKEGILSARYIVGIDPSSAIILSHDLFNHRGSKYNKNDHILISTKMLHDTDHILKFKDVHSVDDEGVEQPDLHVTPSEDRLDYCYTITSYCNYLDRYVLSDLLPNRCMYEKLGLARMVYTEQYDTDFDVETILTKEADTNVAFSVTLKSMGL